MQRFTLTFLAVVSLLLGVSAAIGSQAAPAQADTTIPAYGAPSYLDGSPVGGGVGYLNTISPSQAQYVVSTAAELKAALAAATSGQIVYVADGATILLNSDTIWYGTLPSQYFRDTGGFYVPPGVILAGGRGRSGVTAGVIQLGAAFRNDEANDFIALGAGAKLTGLTIAGPQEEVTGYHVWTGIEGSTNSEVANCEIHGFGYVGVSIFQATGLWVHHCYIHHCQQKGYGYGVAVNASDIYHTASALVEGNRFDYGRHFMSCAKGRASYIFRYNYLGANCTNSLIDAHGQNTGYYEKDGDEYIYPAGERIEVYNNTSIHPANAFVHIRGIPYSTGLVSVHHNWSYTPESFRWSGSGSYDLHQICQCMINMPEYGYDAPTGDPGGPFIRMSVHDNWYGTTTPPSTNAAPVLSAIGNKSIKVRATLSFTISASDANGDALTYSASDLPVGAAFDPATQTFAWTPSQSQVGIYTGVRFQVSDGQMTDYEDITITVSDGVLADVNSDGAVNSLDMIRVGQQWNETGGSGWIPEDINKDGTVNVLDATLVGQYWTG